MTDIEVLKYTIEQNKILLHKLRGYNEGVKLACGLNPYVDKSQTIFLEEVEDAFAILVCEKEEEIEKLKNDK
jgi:hypothetical protein